MRVVRGWRAVAECTFAILCVCPSTRSLCCGVFYVLCEFSSGRWVDRGGPTELPRICVFVLFSLSHFLLFVLVFTVYYYVRGLRCARRGRVSI